MFRRPSAQRDRRSPVSLVLLASLVAKVRELPVRPPVTLALVALMIGIQYRGLLVHELEDALPQRTLILALGLLPARVVRGDWWRVLTAALLHGDDFHLYYNVGSFLFKGVDLEPRMGSARYARLLLLVTLGAGAVHVGCAAALRNLGFPREFNTTAVGFSAVIFGLKAYLQAGAPRDATQTVGLYGLGSWTVPLRWASWAELLLIQLATPNASWLGHASGIITGTLLAATPETLPRWARRAWAALTARPPRVYGAGRSGARPMPPPPAQARAASSPLAGRNPVELPAELDAAAMRAARLRRMGGNR